MTPGSNYLQSLQESNVEVIFQSAVEVTPTGLVDASGNHTEVDVIIFATGFDTSFSPAYKVVGQDGQTLKEAWGDFPKAYLSIMAEGFPNMFRKYPAHPVTKDLLNCTFCFIPHKADFGRVKTFRDPTVPPLMDRSCQSWSGTLAICSRSSRTCSEPPLSHCRRQPKPSQTSISTRMSCSSEPHGPRML